MNKLIGFYSYELKKWAVTTLDNTTEHPSEGRYVVVDPDRATLVDTPIEMKRHLFKQ